MTLAQFPEFGFFVQNSRIGVIVAEMDELLEKKRLEIDALTKQLLAQPSATKIEPAEDFSVDLGSEG